MADTSNVAQILTDLKANERIWVDQNTGITYDKGKMNKPVEVFSGYGLRNPEKVTAVTDWSLGENAITAIQNDVSLEKDLKENKKASEAKAKIIKDENARQNALIDEIARTSDDQAYVDNSRRLAADLQKKDKLAQGKLEAEKVAAEIMAEIKQDTLIKERQQYRTTQKKLVGEQLMRDIDKEYTIEGAQKQYDQAVSDQVDAMLEVAEAKVAKFNAEKPPTDYLINDKTLIAAHSEDGQAYWVPSEGKGLDEVLKSEYAKIDQEVGGSFFTTNKEDIIYTDVHSQEQREILEDGHFVMPSTGEYVETEGRDFHQHLADEAEEKRLEHEAMMKAYRDSIEAPTLNGKAWEDLNAQEKAEVNDQYLGTSGLDAVHAGDDTWEDADGNLTNNQTVIEETKEKIERALALEKDPHLVADEKLIETARKVKEEKEEQAKLLEQSKKSGTIGGDAAERVRQEKIKNLDKNLGSLGQDVSNREILAKERTNSENIGSHIDKNQTTPVGYDSGRTRSMGSHLRWVMRKNKEALRGLGNQNATDTVEKHRERNQLHDKNFLRVYDDPYAFSTLSYPSDLTQNNENGHYILFYVNVQNQTKYEYEGLDSEHKKVTVGDMVEVPGHFKDGDETNVAPSNRGSGEWLKTTSAKSGEHLKADYQKQIIKNGGAGNILYNNMTTLMKSRKGPMTGINSRFKTTTRITDSVALYLPPGINDNLSATYGDSVTGMAGYLALSGIDLVEQIRDHDFAGAASTLFDSGGEIVKEAFKKLAAGAFESFTGSEGIRETFDKAFGQTLNPFIEVTYSSFGLRTFDYTFKFAPKSKKETDEVNAIIKLFRFHMAPELKNTHHRYMTLPSTFDIHYMWQSAAGDKWNTAQENSFYNKIATCVLQSCNVDYTPDGVKSFGDGAPTQINMSLSFKETEMLTKDKINQGF